MEEYRNSSSSNSNSDDSDTSESSSSESNSSNSKDSINQDKPGDRNSTTVQNEPKSLTENNSKTDLKSETSDSDSDSSNSTKSDKEPQAQYNSNTQNTNSNTSPATDTPVESKNDNNPNTEQKNSIKKSSDSNSDSSDSNSHSNSSKQPKSKPKKTGKSTPSFNISPKKPQSNSNSDSNSPKQPKSETKKAENSTTKANNNSSNSHQPDSNSESESSHHELSKTKNQSKPQPAPKSLTNQNSDSDDNDSDNLTTRKASSSTKKPHKKHIHSDGQSSNQESKSKDSDHDSSSNNEIEKQPPNEENSTPIEPKKPFDYTVVQEGLDPDRRTDRYGWAIEENSEPPKHTKSKKKLEKERNREQLREAKWLYMMKKENWDLFYNPKGKHRKVLERRVMKGIPDGVRSVAWRLILDPESISNPSRPTVEYYHDIAIPQCDHVIRVDIPRTMPRVPIFARTDIRTSLYVILRAYSNLDRELDYFQGMGFIAAILVSYMDETSAFWSFEKIMRGPLHMLRNFFLREFKGLHDINLVWDQLLKNKFPTVYRNISSHNVQTMLYTPIWFLTCFMAVDFQPALKLRIFDRFALFGTRAIISFGATIIDLHKQELSIGQADKLIQILNHPQSNPKITDLDNVFKHYDKNFISKRDYDKYCKKAGFDPIP